MKLLSKTLSNKVINFGWKAYCPSSEILILQYLEWINIYARDMMVSVEYYYKQPSMNIITNHYD